jgi:hypothetical protein
VNSSLLPVQFPVPGQFSTPYTAPGKLSAGSTAYQFSALQIILELCITEKELAKTRSQISFMYFQSQS